MSKMTDALKSLDEFNNCIHDWVALPETKFTGMAMYDGYECSKCHGRQYIPKTENR